VSSKEVKVGEAACNKEGGTEVTSGASKSFVCNGKTGFTEVLASGKSERGAWSVSGPAGTTAVNATSVSSAISFNVPLKEPVLEEVEGVKFVHVIAAGTAEGSDPAGCSGTAEAPQASPGNLCVFSLFEENVKVVSGQPVVTVLSGETAAGGAGKSGALIFATAAAAGDVDAGGVWVVTAK
jgi:hypothetical protein